MRSRNPVRVVPAALAALALSATARSQWNSNQLARIYPQPNDLDPSADFGAACDLSGATLIVGAPWHDPTSGTNGMGGAYVFVDPGSGWIQQTKLAGSSHDGGDRFGTSVAIDGDTAVVGAPFDEAAGPAAAGAVYVFVRSGGAWTEQALLVASDAAQFDHFGSSVAIDGDTIAVGSELDDHAAGNDAGSVYVFVRSGNVWTEQARLVAGAAALDDRLGASVAVSGDRLVAGAPRADVSGLGNAGSAIVFEHNGAAWAETATLVSSLPFAGAQLGTSVALDGETVAAGAPFDDQPSSNAGSVGVFFLSGGAWSEQARLGDFGAVAFDEFGTDVDLEGHRLVVGLPYDNAAGLATGGVQLFVRTGATWNGEIEMVGGDCEGGDFLGASVAISGDLVAGGAVSGDTPPTNLPTGEAYVFALVPPPLIEVYCTAKTNSLGCLPSIGSSGAPSASNPLPFLVTCSNVVNFKSGLLYYGYAPAALPFQGGTKCVLSPVQRTGIQGSGGTAPPAADCSGAYAYDFNARIQGGLDPGLVSGAEVYCQYWMRDPQSPSTTGLSNGLHFRIEP